MNFRDCMVFALFSKHCRCGLGAGTTYGGVDEVTTGLVESVKELE